ncbi:hypothetical protein D3C87_1800110 [compost metagenome]
MENEAGDGLGRKGNRRVAGDTLMPGQLFSDEVLKVEEATHWLTSHVAMEEAAR